LKRSDPAPLTLICHAQSPNAAVRSLSASAHLAEAGLVLRFVLTAELAQLRIAPPARPRAADELWRHTCFETFVAGDGAAYHEFNFSPSGEWAAYAFRGYRERGGALPQVDPRIAVHSGEGQLELEATIALELLPASAGPLRLGLCAVIEDRSGALSYWALRHAAGRPDFHHRQGFVAKLESSVDV
jgi:hypothetical protein